MTVKQISVFVENKAGKLAELTEYLHQHDIDMRALSIAETQDFGIVRMIVDDSYKTSCILKEAGYVVSITPVLAVEMPDEPGSLSGIVKTLGDGGINLEYMYAFLTPAACGSAPLLHSQECIEGDKKVLFSTRA